MDLTNSDVVELTALRRKLHAMPEVSGAEVETARVVTEQLATLDPTELITGLGGHGIAAVFESGSAGPTILFRCELDALPAIEVSDQLHRSRIEGRAHLCGHDGHTATLVGLARALSRRRPARGRVIVLFQPAEETGAGAAAVIADPRFPRIAPDYAFSLHNMPGITFGHVWLDEGPANCASRGIRIALTGHTSHASLPEDGISPIAAAARLMTALPALSTGTQRDAAFRLVTVTHTSVGEKAFGMSPGYGEVWATLRTQTDSTMAALCADAEALADEAARAGRLSVEISYHDIFMHCDSHPDAVEILRKALDAENVMHEKGDLPFRASEDFGRFGHGAKSAMFYLGAGTETPPLHTPTYDFPDDLIPIGARIFLRVVGQLLGRSS